MKVIDVPKENREYCGRKLKSLRKGKGLSRRGLARAINKSPTSIANYESGRAVPSTPTAQRISKFFRVDIKDLFEGEAGEGYNSICNSPDYRRKSKIDWERALLGAKMRRDRERKEITLREMVSEIDKHFKGLELTASKLSNMERGKTLISYEIAAAYSYILKVKPSEESGVSQDELYTPERYFKESDSGFKSLDNGAEQLLGYEGPKINDGNLMEFLVNRLEANGGKSEKSVKVIRSLITGMTKEEIAERENSSRHSINSLLSAWRKRSQAEDLMHELSESFGYLSK